MEPQPHHRDHQAARATDPGPSSAVAPHPGQGPDPDPSSAVASRPGQGPDPDPSPTVAPRPGEGPDSDPEWFDANRRMWDERVPIHIAGQFYDVESFRRGRMSLQPFEIEDVGDVAGRDLVHLQCHFGLDTLSWARRGARVTGLDFSAPAVAAARQLAAELALDATFVEANVYDAPAVLARRFDIVYTGLGALCWLPDLERWADVIAALAAPGGIVYIAEFHPLTDMLADHDLTIVRPYFQGADPTVWDEPGTYAELGAATRHNRSYEWTHPVSRVIDSLLRRGLVLERFREHDYTLFPRWPFLRREGHDTYRLPEDMPSLPLMYSARFRRPAA